MRVFKNITYATANLSMFDIIHGVCSLCLEDEDGGNSGDDYLKVDSAWHGDIDSDAESVDSEEEDPLK